MTNSIETNNNVSNENFVICPVCAAKAFRADEDNIYNDSYFCESCETGIEVE